MASDRGIEQQLAVDQIANEVLKLVRSPAWGFIRHYLRVKREGEAKKLLYFLKPSTNPDEMAIAQGTIRMIDELLADTEESSLQLAHAVGDFAARSLEGPYREKKAAPPRGRN